MDWLLQMETGITKVIKGLGLYFYKLAEQSGDVFWVRSANLESQLYTSPSFSAIWERDRDHLYHAPELWPNAIHPEDRLRVLRVWRQCITNPTQSDHFEYRYRILCPNGIEKKIQESLFPIFDSGELVGVAGISKEIISESRAAVAPEDSKLIELLQQDQKRVYWLKDQIGNFSFLSKKDNLPWDVARSEIKQQADIWKRHVHPDDVEKLSVKNILEAAGTCSQNEAISITYRMIKANSAAIWLRDTYHVEKDETGKLNGFSGFTEIVTEDMHRQRELAQAKASAVKAGNYKTDFLAMMTHELRTPLNAILGMSQLMSSTNLSPAQRDQLDVIASAGKTLLSSINDLFDCAELDLGSTQFKEEEVTLRPFLAQVLDDFKREHLSDKTAITAGLEHDSVIPDVVCIDKEKVHKIVSNLLINALNFTSAGQIQLKSKCLQQNRHEAVVCITIEDSGTGIQKSELHQIFNQMEQDEKSVFTRPKECLGIGLVIVRELVERMGGSLAVSSEPGYGSQFSCIIPMKIKEKQAQVQSQPQDVKAIRTEKKLGNEFDLNVLVVEDNPINQKITKIMLEQVGCKVDIADCGKLAIQKMNDDYDMVFMDIGLPDIDGFETTSQIRSLQPASKHTPIVAMTAHVFNQDRERCFKVGMDEVIAKPILREDLVSILKKWAAPISA